MAEIARLAGYALQSVRNGLLKRGVRLRTRRAEPEEVRRLRERRCKVTSFGLRQRLARGMDPETAITTKAWATSVRCGSRMAKARRRR